MDGDGPKVGSTDFGSRWHVRGGKASNRGCLPGFPLEAVALDSSSHVFTVSTYLRVLPHVCLFLLTGVWAGVGEHFDEGPLLFLGESENLLLGDLFTLGGWKNLTFDRPQGCWGNRLGTTEHRKQRVFHGKDVVHSDCRWLSPVSRQRIVREWWFFLYLETYLSFSCTS